MIGAIDRWVGKTLFVPLIVRFCQRFGVSQFLVHNFLYLIGSYMLLMAAMAKSGHGGAEFVLALVLTVKIGRNPEYPGYESAFLRRFFLLANVVHVAAHLAGKTLLIAGPNWDLSCPVVLMWLTAEYARTIKTIPPLEEKEPASARLIEAKATRL
jgi:hypothetical protein